MDVGVGVVVPVDVNDGVRVCGYECGCLCGCSLMRV